MRINLLVILVPALASLIGCKNDGSNDRVGKACTMVGSIPTMRVQVNSSTPLPTNLAIAFNGNDVDVDECPNENLAGQVKVSPDRLQAEAVFYFSYNPEDYEFYFPDGAEKPDSALLNLGLYSRSSCSDTHVKFDEILDAEISWKPDYANGKDCGTTSYSGEAETQTD